VQELPKEKQSTVVEEAVFQQLQNWFVGGAIHCIQLTRWSDPVMLEKVFVLCFEMLRFA